MTISPEEVLRLLLAILVGGLIGIERELHHKAAGFRTIILICVGASLFTIFSLKLDGTGRVAANIVSGVGFIGAGVILHDAGRITGLTTASTIWLSAALGMGIGAGYYLYAGITTVILMIVLSIFPGFERWISRVRDVRSYEIVFAVNTRKLEQLEALFPQCGVGIYRRKWFKRGESIISTWDCYGPAAAQERLVKELVADAEVKEFHY
jgi:putative Mg2+ transporter-C (MgtC) family protein